MGGAGGGVFILASASRQGFGIGTGAGRIMRTSLRVLCPSHPSHAVSRVRSPHAWRLIPCAGSGDGNAVRVWRQTGYLWTPHGPGDELQPDLAREQARFLAYTGRHR